MAGQLFSVSCFFCEKIDLLITTHQQLFSELEFHVRLCVHILHLHHIYWAWMDRPQQYNANASRNYIISWSWPAGRIDQRPYKDVRWWLRTLQTIDLPACLPIYIIESSNLHVAKLCAHVSFPAYYRTTYGRWINVFRRDLLHQKQLHFIEKNQTGQPATLRSSKN